MMNKYVLMYTSIDKYIMYIFLVIDTHIETIFVIIFRPRSLTQFNSFLLCWFHCINIWSMLVTVGMTISFNFDKVLLDVLFVSLMTFILCSTPMPCSHAMSHHFRMTATVHRNSDTPLACISIFHLIMNCHICLSCPEINVLFPSLLALARRANLLNVSWFDPDLRVFPYYLKGRTDKGSCSSCHYVFWWTVRHQQ